MISITTESIIVKQTLHWSVLSYITASLAFVYLIVYKWRNRRFHKMLEQFNSMSSLPIIGSLHLVFGNIEQRIRKLIKIHKNYETPVIFWLSFVPIMIVTKPDDIQIISQKSQERDTFGVLQDIIGRTSVVNAPQAKWKQTRRILNPAFSLSMIYRYVTVFNEKAQLLVNNFKSIADTGAYVDMWPYMTNINIDIITENLTGYRIESCDLINEFSNCLMNALKMESMRFISPWLYPRFCYKIYLWLIGCTDSFDNIHNLPRQVLQANKKKFEMQKQHLPTNPKYFEENPPETLIEMLLRAQDANPSSFSDLDVLNEIVSLIATGSESTAVTSSFMLLMFAMHPDIQEKAYQEVQSIMKASVQHLDVDDLNEFTYVEQCVKETLRLFTLLPLTLRRSMDDITLSDKRIIPANCLIFLALYAVNVDPTIYPNPRQWNPDHFSPEAVQNNGKNTFLPFGSGPRGCIGSRYAMLSLKTQMIYILRNYRLSTNLTLRDIHLTMDLVVRNKNGYRVKFESRKKE